MSEAGCIANSEIIMWINLFFQNKKVYYVVIT